MLLSGFAALSWEVLWQLHSGLALGVSAWGAALTLATTMLGFGAGAICIGKATKQLSAKASCLFFALCEGVIALNGYFLSSLFEAASSLDTLAFAQNPQIAPFIYTFCQVAIIGVPAFLMGATLPLLGRLAAVLKIQISLLYGLNTFGGALGCLGVAFWLIPQFGVHQSSLVLSGINAAAALLLTLFSFHKEVTPAPVARHLSGSGEPLDSVTLLHAFLTGFVTLSLEVAWFRAFRGAFRSTTESFALMLCTVLVALALGARLSESPLLKKVPNVRLLVLAGIGILVSTPFIERLDSVSHLALHPVQLTWFVLIMLVVIVPITCLGAVLPRLLDKATANSSWGQVYSINTLGAALGGITSAWVFLPVLGFSYTAIALAILLAGASLAAKSRESRILLGVFLVIGFISLRSLSGVGVTRVVGRLGVEQYSLLEYRETPDSAIAAIEFPTGERGLIIDGFHAATELKLGHYMRWMGHLPMLLHTDPKRALVICFGTGQTADAVRAENPETLQIVDLNAAVLQLAHWFPKNNNVLEDPRVQTTVMDGRAFVRRTERTFDVVTLEPMPPNFAGVNSLYSKEFYELVAEKLDEGGTIAQWVTFRLVSPHLNASIVKTFTEVFPNSFLWIDPLSQTGIVVGKKTKASTQAIQLPGFNRPGITRDLTQFEVEAAIALQGEALKAYAATGALITDDNQALAFGAQIHEALLNPNILEDNLALVRQAQNKALQSVRDSVKAQGPEAEVALLQLEALQQEAQRKIAAAQKDIQTIKGLAADAMVAAAFAGRIEDLKTAVASGTSPNRIDPKYRISPLSAAVSRGQIEAAKYLLEAGADINFQDSSGYTALMHAILNKQITSVRFLLEKGADLSIKNIARQTALDFARMNKAEDAVSEILKQCPTCS